jgi:protein-tyrosine phosphatase
MSGGMVDLHCHILPGVDHGPATIDESIEMARVAVADGVGTVVATPHVNFEFPTTPEAIRRGVELLSRRLRDEGIDLVVLPGGDYQLTPELLSGREPIVTVGDAGRHFLLELPSNTLLPNLPDIIRRFVDRGLVPIVTHPEREVYLMRKPGHVAAMAKAGGLVQVTAGSLLGDFGDGARQSAEVLVKEGLCTVIASDAHWAAVRPPVLSAARERLDQLGGSGTADRLTRDAPAGIIRGEAPAS